VLRTPITLAAVSLAAALTLSACGTVQLGAAAVTSNSRIPTSTVATEVSDLTTAYQADKAKAQLQFAASQTPQVVLGWLLRFKVRDQMAARYHLTVTDAEVQQALASATAQARQSGVTLAQLAVANGVPPDQIQNLGRYLAIQNAVLDRMDGGKLPTGNSALSGLSARFGTAQCRAAKSLAIRVNPQYGALDYSQIAVVPAPDKLAAAAGPASASPSATSSPQLTPHC
jgi:peptidyl-prolyl cis-trans isomerase SurA